MLRLLALVLLGTAGCGSDKPGADAAVNPSDRGIFEGPVTKKDPDQGPVPDWILALREAGLKDSRPRETAPREAAPADGATAQ